MLDIFKIESQYTLYLQRMGLKESDMQPQQKIETKRAFFGAFGQALMLLRDDLPELSDEEGYKKLESMITEVGQFFMEETHKQN